MSMKIKLKYALILVTSLGLAACNNSNDSDTIIMGQPAPAAATISGDTSGSINEDETNVTGSLTVNDPNANESEFQSQTDTALTFGSFSISSSGGWTYSLDNENVAVQELNEGVVVNDSVTVSSVDGTSQDIAITITGVNDEAVFGAGDGIDAASIGNDFNGCGCC